MIEKLLSEQQVETLLKLMLVQKKETLARLQEIEKMPDDGTVDKMALLSEAVGGVNNEKA